MVRKLKAWPESVVLYGGFPPLSKKALSLLGGLCLLLGGLGEWTPYTLNQGILWLRTPWPEVSGLGLAPPLLPF